MNEYVVEIKSRALIWTGDENRKMSSILRETGILGSIRWWYEAMIRGLGGTACDPTNTKCNGENHCVACELFGCTGWARKFKLQIDVINASEKIIFNFIPLREIRDVEWALLNLTLHLIAKYGAIGGKTVFKPSDEDNNKNKFHHKDFGLIEVINSNLKMCKKEQIEDYVKDERWQKPKQDDFSWVSIQNLWCVNGKYLCREGDNKSSFNRVLGRKESKREANRLKDNNNNVSRWLAGSLKESKKVFSFKNPARTFGFINPDVINFEKMRERLKSAWSNENSWEFLQGNDIINSLMKELLGGEDDS